MASLLREVIELAPATAISLKTLRTFWTLRAMVSASVRVLASGAWPVNSTVRL
ncbi:hypothetical protein D3C83_55440 [compost metagenome]